MQSNQGSSQRTDTLGLLSSLQDGQDNQSGQTGSLSNVLGNQSTRLGLDSILLRLSTLRTLGVTPELSGATIRTAKIRGL